MLFKLSNVLSHDRREVEVGGEESLPPTVR